MKNLRQFVWVLIIGMFLVIGSTRASATVWTMTEGNSTVLVEDSENQDGMFSWTVNGVEHLQQQWFWYRVGNTDPERSLDNEAFLTLTEAVQPLPDMVRMKYADAVANRFDIEITYMLEGGPIGTCSQSDMAETIKITNKTNSTLNFHFFQYTDFDLNGSADNDWAEHTSATAFHQYETGTGCTFNETIGTEANRWQVALAPTILDSLNDALPTTLPNTQDNSIGNTSFAWEWDLNIARGGSFIISKNKKLGVVPEPSTILLFSLGFMGLGVAGFKRRKMEL